MAKHRINTLSGVTYLKSIQPAKLTKMKRKSQASLCTSLIRQLCICNSNMDSIFSYVMHTTISLKSEESIDDGYVEHMYSDQTNNSPLSKFCQFPQLVRYCAENWKSLALCS